MDLAAARLLVMPAYPLFRNSFTLLSFFSHLCVYTESEGENNVEMLGID